MVEFNKVFSDEGEGAVAGGLVVDHQTIEKK